MKTYVLQRKQIVQLTPVLYCMNKFLQVIILVAHMMIDIYYYTYTKFSTSLVSTVASL